MKDYGREIYEALNQPPFWVDDWYEPEEEVEENGSETDNQPND